MSDRFIGPGGNNSNDGLTWANRWLDFTNVTAANFPTNANRRCVVGPGVYYFSARKDMPTASSGFLHEYVGDYPGALTDGEGGRVILTNRNTNNIDYAFTSDSVLNFNPSNFVTIRGFIFDAFGATIGSPSTTTLSNLVIEDCVFTSMSTFAFIAGLNVSANTSITNRIIRRCLFVYGSRRPALIAGSGTGTPSGNIIENCLSFNGVLARISDANGLLFNACSSLGHSANDVGYAIEFVASGQTGTVKNSFFQGHGISAHATNSIVEDYNVFAQGEFSARQNVSAGSNSLAGAIALRYPMLYPQLPGISSTLRHLRLQTFAPTHGLSSPDTDMPTEDLFGLKRPTALAKRTNGAIQRQPVSRTSSPVHTGSYSLRFTDAGRYQVLVPYTGSGQRTVSVRVQRQSDYSGSNLPGIVIKQPYQADITVADTGGTGTWNEVTHTFTPAALPKWYVVELFSDNEATSGAYEVYFDTFVVT